MPCVCRLFRWRAVFIIPDAGIGAFFEEKLDHKSLSLVGSHMKRSDAFVRLGIGIRAVGDQDFANFTLAPPRRAMEGRPAALIDSADKRRILRAELADLRHPSGLGRFMDFAHDMKK